MNEDVALAVHGPVWVELYSSRHLHLVVSPVGGNLRKMNTGAQLQTFPYPTASKSFLYSNAFMAKTARTNSESDVQKRDGQTNRDKQKTHVFGRPGGG